MATHRAACTPWEARDTGHLRFWQLRPDVAFTVSSGYNFMSAASFRIDSVHCTPATGAFCDHALHARSNSTSSSGGGGLSGGAIAGIVVGALAVIATLAAVLGAHRLRVWALASDSRPCFMPYMVQVL